MTTVIEEDCREHPLRKMEATLDKRESKNVKNNCKEIYSRCSIALCVIILSCILLASVNWIIITLQQKVVSSPTSTSSSTISPHLFHTLPQHELIRRTEYFNNSFVQLLHQHQLVINTTDCWVCGLIPHTVEKGMPYLVLPFSYEGSAWAYFVIFNNAYQSKIKQPVSSHSVGSDFSHSLLIKGMVAMAKIMEKSEASIDERKAYTNWNITNYISSLNDKIEQGKSPPIRVIPQQGNFCLQINGRTPNTGQRESLCSHTYVYSALNSLPLVPSQGTYFVCHDRAYTWLPADFSGTCYIAFLLPPTYTAPANHHKNRYGRGIVDSKDTAGQEGGDFLKGFLPFWGPMANSRNIRQLVRVVETTIDITVGALSNITAELQADRLMTLQNRVALDFVLADRGGVCKLIGSSCCIFIPNDAPTVYQAISKLHIISESIHQDEGDWSFSEWFWGLLSKWGWKVLTFFGVILAFIFSCCLCMHCGPAICNLCATACIPKPKSQRAENIKMMVQQQLDDLMAIDIDSD